MAFWSGENTCELFPSEFCDQPILVSQLDEIAIHLEDWESLAPFISISSQEMNEISSNYCSNYRLQKRMALRTWREKEGCKATIKQLACIFCQQGLQCLAEKIVEICKLERPTSIIVLKKYLCNHYCNNVHHPSSHQWPAALGFELPQIDIYVDLTLHEIPKNDHENLDSQSIVDGKYKVVELGSVFAPSSSRMIVFFEGIGGSGKTTLAWYTCKEWATDTHLQQFQLLIHVQLNDPRLQGLKKLELKDLIPDPDVEACKEYATAIEDIDGKGVCIFLEGLDETPKQLLQPLLSFIVEISKKLCHLSFIMTTRPDGRILRSLHMVITSRILIKGFDRNRLGNFLDSSLGTCSDERAGLARKFDIYPQLEALASLPINAVILSFLVKYFKDELPVTQTGLFNLLICHACNRHIQLKEPELPPCISNPPHDLPSGLKEAFQNLCLLAYKLLQENKRLFSALDVGKFDNSLGLLQLRQNMSMYGLKEYYSFPHLSLQQFLAAIHLSQIEEIKQADFVKKLLNQDPLSHVIPFFAGLTHLTNKIVVRILEISLKHITTSRAILTQLESSNSSDPRRKVVALMNSLYECQDDKLTDQIEAANENDPVCNEMLNKAGIPEIAPDLKVIILKSLPLTPRDCLSIGYFGRVKSKPSALKLHKCNPLMIMQRLIQPETIMFDLSSCSLSDTGIEALTAELGKGIYTPTLIRIHLGLSHNLLNTKSLTCIKKLVSEHHNVSVLSLPSCLHPQFVDLNTALKLIIEGVNRSVVHLLNLSENHLSIKHTHYLVLLLTFCRSINWLTMKSFPLSSPKVIKLFCGALRVSCIGTLDISACGINDSGLAILGKAVCAHKSLSHLRMFKNRFTDRSLAKFLRLFLDKSHSNMTFLGVKMNAEHKKILEEINRFRTTKNMTKLEMSFEDIPHYQRASQETRALNLHDEFKKHNKDIAITYSAT